MPVALGRNGGTADFVLGARGGADGCGGPVDTIDKEVAEFPRCYVLSRRSRGDGKAYVLSGSATFEGEDGATVRYVGSVYDQTWAEEFLLDEDAIVLDDIFEGNFPTWY